MENGEETQDSDVLKPSWYADRKIEVIEYIKDSGHAKGFCLGSAMKYISRAGKKDPRKTKQDLMKARWFLNYAIENFAEIFGDENG